ncbi:MAG: 6-bladed beta-propeller [Phocaeicola plebeius]
MKRTIFACYLLWIGILSSCTSNTDTEKHQHQRDNIVDVHDQVKEFQTGDVLIGSYSRLFILGEYLIIGDYKSTDKLIHLFNKNDFSHIASTATMGQGPGEIAVMGHIGIDEQRGKFYVSDHGKMKIFSYDVDSVCTTPNYMPRVKVEINMTRFPDKYVYVNDTLSFALMIEPTSASTFNQAVAKWNIEAGTFEPMKYQHPDIQKKRISFAVSLERGIYAECYTYHDLMSICTTDGSMICNVYGPAWDATVSNRIKHYGDVVICGDKIVAAYSGSENFTDARYPTQLLVFNLEGDYLKTLNVGYRITDLCYDKESNRLLMVLNDDIQFGYLSLEHII